MPFSLYGSLFPWASLSVCFQSSDISVVHFFFQIFLNKIWKKWLLEKVFLKCFWLSLAWSVLFFILTCLLFEWIYFIFKLHNWVTGCCLIHLHIIMDWFTGKALMAIKASFSNVANVLLDWNDAHDEDFCSWRGVFCDNVSLSVASLWVFSLFLSPKLFFVFISIYFWSLNSDLFIDLY